MQYAYEIRASLGQLSSTRSHSNYIWYSYYVPSTTVWKWVLEEEIWWSPNNTDKDVPDVPSQAEIQSQRVLWCTLQFTILSLSSSFSWRCIPTIAHSPRSEIAEKIFHSGYSNFHSLSLFIYICSGLKAQLRFWPGSILRRTLKAPAATQDVLRSSEPLNRSQSIRLNGFNFSETPFVTGFFDNCRICEEICVIYQISTEVIFLSYERSVYTVEIMEGKIQKVSLIMLRIIII